jgi:hypothetical protein
MNCFAIKQTQFDEIKKIVCFQTHLLILVLYANYDLLEENNPFCLLHNLLYMDVIFISTYYILPLYLGI